MVGGCLGLGGSSRRADQRLSDHISIGVLTRVFPPEVVDRVVAEAGRVEQRQRLLPARVVVYYVLALALFADSSYEEVMRQLVEGLAWESGWQRAWEVPSKAAIFKARRRLGREPLELLFRAVASPLAVEATRGAFYRGLRLMSLDGTCLDVADTPANEEAFGRPGSARREGGGAFPQLRLVALAESGTHAITDAALGPYTSRSTRWPTGCWARSAGDAVPGRPWLLQLRALPERPCDRGGAALAREGEHAAAPRAPLSDGSYLTRVYAPSPTSARNETALRCGSSNTSSRTPGCPRASSATGCSRRILDPDAAPAGELGVLYSNAGSSRAPSTSSRPTSAARAWCCAQSTPTASTKKPTATSAPTTRSGA